MKLKEIVTDEVRKTSSGSTYDDLDSPQVESGTILEVTRIAVENETTAYTRLTIGPADGHSYQELEEEDLPAADDIHWTSDPLYVIAGKKLRARLTGCTSGDVIRMTYQGRLYFTDEG